MNKHSSVVSQVLCFLLSLSGLAVMTTRLSVHYELWVKKKTRQIIENKKKDKKEYKQRDDVMPPAHHAHSDIQTHIHTCLNVYTKRKDSGITRDSENAHPHTHKKKTSPVNLV